MKVVGKIDHKADKVNVKNKLKDLKSTSDFHKAPMSPIIKVHEPSVFENKHSVGKYSVGKISVSSLNENSRKSNYKNRISNTNQHL